MTLNSLTGTVGWPLTFLARHHAGPFINLVRQNPVLQIQRSQLHTCVCQ